MPRTAADTKEVSTFEGRYEMHDGPGSPLTLDQAYQAAYLWMFHVGEPPTEIVERGSHAVELRSTELAAFVRVPDRPLNQRTVLAVLATESDGRKQVIFSGAGFSPPAISIAEAQGIALFSLESDGSARPRNGQAAALTTTDAPPTPFAVAPTEGGIVAAFSEWGKTDFSADEWIDCPGCGTNQHHTLDACRLCGTAFRDEASLGSAPDGLDYRCRECGSHDVEIVAANDP
ncbi:MAG: hypothetical protein M3096_00670, partial [Actinomycetia bacterium]|nr:hypothetical protein [Actinomycetes bacterium]